MLLTPAVDVDDTTFQQPIWSESVLGKWDAIFWRIYRSVKVNEVFTRFLQNMILPYYQQYFW